MPFRRCFAGCPHGGAIIYPFPPNTDVARRELWIRQFGKIPGKRTQKHLYACRRHFSSYMTFGRLLRKNAYPDVNLSTYDTTKPYTERYSYYKCNMKPDPQLHDNFCEEWLVPPKDCGIDLEFTPIECIVPLSNELSHSETSDSDNDEGKQQEEINTKQTAVEQQPSNSSQAETTEYAYYRSKRQCILECKGRRSFHILPSIENELERRHKWLYLLGKDPALYTQKRLYVCDLHFDIHMIGISKLIRGAYPNKNLPPRLIKSIPAGLEPQTECIQKCSDYKRKFKFPTLNLKMREAWLLKFGYNPTFYKHDIYACDRHFSDEMRVGPFLQANALPDQNLKLRALCEDNMCNYVSKNWSLQRLDALANEVTVPTTITTQKPTATTTTTDAPTINIIFSPTGTITKIISSTTTTTTMISPNATTTTVISPTIAATNMFSPTATTTTMISPIATTTSRISPTVAATTTHSTPQIIPQMSTINQPHTTVIPTASQKPKTPVEYVKMHSLGVFMQEKDGYVISLQQILKARDPLDFRRYMPTYCHEPIEPKINIQVHPIPKEIYEGNSEQSEDDASRSASPTYMDYTVEASDVDAPVYNIKRNDLGYATVEMSKLSHANDMQQNNGKLKNRKGYYDYHSSVYEGPINNIKRKNYDLDYAMAKRVLLNVQRKGDELCGSDYQEDNSANTLNDLSGNAVMEDPMLDHLAETYPTETFSIRRGQNNTIVKYKQKTAGANKADDVIIPDEPRVVSKAQTQLTTTTVNKNVVTAQPKTNSLRTLIIPDELRAASKAQTQLKATTVNRNVITTQPKQQQQNTNSLTTLIIPDELRAASKAQTQLKATTVNRNVIKTQPKQQQNTNSLTKAVALAESWQQVVQTMKKEPLMNANACANMQQQPDAITLATRKLVEQIKQAGERDKLGIYHKRIADNVTAAGISAKQILGHVGSTTKIFNKTDPKAFQITNVQIINPKRPLFSGTLAKMKSTHEMHDDPKRAKITKVEIINSKMTTNAANGNAGKITETRAQQFVEKRKEILNKMDGATAAKTKNTTTATITTKNTTTTTTQTLFETRSTNSHVQAEAAHDTVNKLLAKAKRILSANNGVAPANSHKQMLSNALYDDDEDDELLKYPEMEISFVPLKTTTTSNDADDNDAVPRCILKCANFRKLYEFPTPDVQTFQRHFWFLQLGLDIASDWRKTLYICEKHFDDTMLLAPDNALNEYAYPCKSLVRQLNMPTATVGTQTDDNAVQYKQRLLDQLAALQQTLHEQRLEEKRVKMLIRLKQAAASLMAEIEEEKNAPKLLTIYNK